MNYAADLQLSKQPFRAVAAEGSPNKEVACAAACSLLYHIKTGSHEFSIFKMKPISKKIFSKYDILTLLFKLQPVNFSNMFFPKNPSQNFYRRLIQV